MNEIGSIIKKYRKNNGITSIQLAKMIGVSQGTVSQIETGQREPSVKLLTKIIEVLHISNLANNDNTNVEQNKQEIFKIETGDTEAHISIVTSNPNNSSSYDFESTIIIKSVLEFLQSKKGEMKKLIVENLLKELDEMQSKYTSN